MQAFSGLKIIDFSSLLPGPLATLYFADWGADVIRVEAPDREDMSRTIPPFVEGTSTTHAFLNRSKKSVCLDLKDPEARESVLSLLHDADVVLEQFRPGVMARFGLDYDSLKERYPRLIYCSLTGYGQDGPLAQKAGHDINYAALTGLAAMTGTMDQGPILHGSPVCDMVGSFHAVMGILMALYHRERTGHGQLIDVSMSDASLMVSALWMQMTLTTHHGPRWGQTLLNGGSFYGYYRTKDDQYLSVGGLEPKFLKGFLEAIDALSLLNGDLSQAKHQKMMQTAIQERIQTKTQAEWMQIFEKLDVCVEPVLHFRDIASHPHFLARSMFVEVPYEHGGTQTQIANPLRFSNLKPHYHHIGTTKGRDNGLLKPKD